MFQAYNNNQNSFNVSQSNNINSVILSNIFNQGVTDEVSKVLSWLSPLEAQVRHEDIRTQRVNDVGSWLLQTEKFRSWCSGSENTDSDHTALFCHGHPGVGKSFITSLVIDSLCDQARGKDIAVLCFYFDFASRKEQTPTNMLGSLLKQLVCGLEKIPEVVLKECREQQKVIGGRRLEVSGIVRMFQALSSTKPTFICIDALDECLPEHRAEILSSLGHILQRSRNTRLFMTGRPQISGEVERQLGGRSASLSIIPTENDIARYIKEKLQKDTTPEVMTSRLKEDIMKGVPEKISETFLLVSLNIESILRETTISRRKGRLRAMTNGAGLGLESAYGATLDRIKAQTGAKSELAMTALMWICHADRPLKENELCHALAVEIRSRDFDIENVPLIGTLLNCCQGLITVDKEASTVRLVHHTLQEYLSSDSNLFPRAHSTIAEMCLTYLISQRVKSLSPYPLPDLGDVPFLRYASLHWGAHAKKELSNHAKSLALEVMDHYEDHVSAILLLQERVNRDFSYDNYNSSQCTGLHCASYFGIVELVIALMEMEGSDINKVDCSGQRPISWAAANGHEALVKRLLEREDVIPDVPDIYGSTPLWYAAVRGHDGVVKLLLERKDVKPNARDNEGRTPLWCAAILGYDSVVKLLLGQEDVSPDARDNEGRTPLFSAATRGHGSVVKLLLGRGGVDPDALDNEGATPLSWAANYGHYEVVKLLLESEDVNPDKRDKDGKTPLWTAAAGGYDSVVKLLLERTTVKPDARENAGVTPLWCAASNGHDSVVKLLLERKDVNPDAPDEYRITPLQTAAARGREVVVKLLLQRQDVKPGRLAGRGRTPLSSAAAYGQDSVVKLLLQHPDVNPNMPDDDGQTPFSRAVSNGHDIVVNLLKGWESATSLTPEKENQVLRRHTAVNVTPEIVKTQQTPEVVNSKGPKGEDREQPESAVRRGFHRVKEFPQSRKQSPTAIVAYASGMIFIIFVVAYFSSPFLL